MTDLEAVIRAAFAGGLSEIAIRVSRYENGQPVAFQAIAKHSTAQGGPWGVGVLTDPVSAAHKALGEVNAPAEKKDTGAFG